MALVTSIVGAAALQGPLLHVPRPQLPTLDTARTTTPQLQWINEDFNAQRTRNMRGQGQQGWRFGPGPANPAAFNAEQMRRRGGWAGQVPGMGLTQQAGWGRPPSARPPTQGAGFGGGWTASPSGASAPYGADNRERARQERQFGPQYNPFDSLTNPYSARGGGRRRRRATIITRPRGT